MGTNLTNNHFHLGQNNTDAKLPHRFKHFILSNQHYQPQNNSELLNHPHPQVVTNLRTLLTAAQTPIPLRGFCGTDQQV